MILLLPLASALTPQGNFDFRNFYSLKNALYLNATNVNATYVYSTYFCNETGSCATLTELNMSGTGTSGVPYTGATQNVDLNDKNLTNIDRLGIGVTEATTSLDIAGERTLAQILPGLRFSGTGTEGNPSLALKPSTSANAGARGWIISPNIQEWGDLAFRQTTSLDGDPMNTSAVLTRMIIQNDGNLKMWNDRNISAGWFKGAFNWLSGDAYSTFNGTVLFINESKINETIDVKISTISGLTPNVTGSGITGMFATWYNDTSINYSEPDFCGLTSLCGYASSIDLSDYVNESMFDNVTIWRKTDNQSLINRVNQSGYIINWNSSGHIVDWSQVISGSTPNITGSGLAAGGVFATWTNATNLNYSEPDFCELTNGCGYGGSSNIGNFTGSGLTGTFATWFNDTALNYSEPDFCEYTSGCGYGGGTGPNVTGSGITGRIAVWSNDTSLNYSDVASLEQAQFLSNSETNNPISFYNQNIFGTGYSAIHSQYAPDNPTNQGEIRMGGYAGSHGSWLDIWMGDIGASTLQQVFRTDRDRLTTMFGNAVIGDNTDATSKSLTFDTATQDGVINYDPTNEFDFDDNVRFQSGIDDASNIVCIDTENRQLEFPDTNVALDWATSSDLKFYSANTHQLSVVDGILQPATTNDIDLGSSTFYFKDEYLNGNLYLKATNEYITAIAGTSIDTYIGNVKQIELRDGVLAPQTTNDIDLGDSDQYFKDEYLNGNLYLKGINEYITSIASTSIDIYANNVKQVEFRDGVFAPQTTNDIDLGDSDQYFKDEYLNGNLYLKGINEYITSIASTSIDIYANNVKQVEFRDGVFAPQTTNDIDLGDSDQYFKDEYLFGNLYFKDGGQYITGTVAQGLDLYAGGTEQIEIVDGSIRGAVDNDVDLGGAANYFKDTYIKGNVYLEDTGQYITSTGAQGLDFYAGGTEQIEIVDGSIRGAVDNDVDLGDNTHYFKDSYIKGYSYFADTSQKIYGVAATSLNSDATTYINQFIGGQQESILSASAFYPFADEGLDLGVDGTNRFKRGYFYSTTGTVGTKISDSSIALYSTDGTHVVNLADGTNAITMTGAVHPVADEGATLGDDTFRFQSGRFYTTVAAGGAVDYVALKAGATDNGFAVTSVTGVKGTALGGGSATRYGVWGEATDNANNVAYGIYGVLNPTGGTGSAGYFTDGTRIVELSDLTNGVDVNDGTTTSQLSDGTQAGDFIYGAVTTQLATATVGVTTTDGTRTVTIADGTNGITVTGGGSDLGTSAEADAYTVGGTPGTDTDFDIAANTQIAFDKGLATAVTTVYDSRFMQNITYLTNTNKMIEPAYVSFYWNELGLAQFDNIDNKPTGMRYGYVAQDIQRIHPECIITEDRNYTGSMITYYGYRRDCVESINVKLLSEKNSQIQEINNSATKLKTDIANCGRTATTTEAIANCLKAIK